MLYWLDLLTIFYGGALGDARGLPFDPPKGLSLSEIDGILKHPPMMIHRGEKTLGVGVIGQVSGNTELSLGWINRFTQPESPSLNFKTFSLLEKEIREEWLSSHPPDFSPPEPGLFVYAFLSLLNSPLTIPKQPISIYVDLLRNLVSGQQPIINMGKRTHPKIVEAVLRAQKGKKDWDVSDNSIEPLVHALYCSVYAAFHFETHEAAISWVLSLGGFTSFNASSVGSVMGAKIGHRFLLNLENQRNLSILLKSDSAQGDFPRPARYHPNRFSHLLLKWSQRQSHILTLNPNFPNILSLFNLGFIPTLVLGPQHHRFDILLFFPEEIVTLSIMEESDVYIVEHIDTEPAEVSIILKAIQSDPQNIKALFDIFPSKVEVAYTLFNSFSESLKKQALGLADASLKIQDPTQPIYDQLYGHTFFISNP